MTGESVPSEKDATAIVEAEAPLGDRSNMVFSGCSITYGTATAVVTATGMDTEMGKIADALAKAEEGQTPLQIKLGQLSHLLSKLVIGICVFIFAFTLLRNGEFSGEVMLDTFMVAVSLAVAAIPEGLATVVTIVLSIGVTNMSHRNAIIRKLTAVETLGCTQIICSDKTGTLTQNQMVVMATDFYGSNNRIVDLNVAVNSTAELAVEDKGEVRVIGNPTEGALLKWLNQMGKDYENYRRRVKVISQIPFSTERKYMETTVEMTDRRVFRLIKGAPEIVLSMSDNIAGATTEKEVFQTLTRYQSKAMRTLRFAYQEIKSGKQTPVVFLGVVGIADPVREDVIEAIDTCRNRAGVRVIIVTGDTPGTANEIGLKLLKMQKKHIKLILKIILKTS